MIHPDSPKKLRWVKIQWTEPKYHVEVGSIVSTAGPEIFYNSFDPQSLEKISTLV